MTDGTIYDLAYTRYQGGRTSPAYRWVVIATSALRMQLRSWWVRALLVCALPVLTFYALSLAFNGMLGAMVDASRTDAAMGQAAVSGQSITTFLLVLVCGAPAIASDLRAGAFQFYFARPVSPGQYLAGRVAGALALPLILAGVSMGVLGIERVALGGALSSVALVLLKALGPMVLRPLAVVSVALGVSSLTRQRGIAQAMYAGVMIAAWLLTRILSYAKDAPWVKWLNVTGGADALGDQSLGLLHAHGWRAAVPAAATAFWIAGFLALALWRLQRAEVVRG